MTADALDGDEVSLRTRRKHWMILHIDEHKVTVKNTIHLELIIQCFPLQVHPVAGLN